MPSECSVPFQSVSEHAEIPRNETRPLKTSFVKDAEETKQKQTNNGLAFNFNLILENAFY